MEPEATTPEPIITIRNIKSDLSGKKYGPWLVKEYVHHRGNTPIWLSECIYCNKEWATSIPKMKRKRECECEESMKFTSGVYIYNSIYNWYASKARDEDALWRLSYTDLYKIYLRQNGVDSEGNKLVFDYYYNYHENPPTCNYIWPDLNRYNKTGSYSLDNCYFVDNSEQRFPRKHKSNTKKILEKFKDEQ